MTMRKPRDFDAELKALDDRAKELKTKKVQQLGELVIATGADSLRADELAGALIVLVETRDVGRREAWAKRGAAFFQGRARRSAPTYDGNDGGATARPAPTPDRDAGGIQSQSGGAQSPSGGQGAD